MRTLLTAIALFASVATTAPAFAEMRTFRSVMFAPLAFTKTYAMAVSAGLGITLVPELMGYFIRGKTPDEHANPLNRWLIRAYAPLLDRVLQWPKVTLAIAAALLLATLYPLSHVGSEFMPALDEGDLRYMPSTLPGISAREAGRLLQQTDRLIKTVPEVDTVFGKAGRAETATDPAPLTMIETMVKPLRGVSVIPSTCATRARSAIRCKNSRICRSLRVLPADTP